MEVNCASKLDEAVPAECFIDFDFYLQKLVPYIFIKKSNQKSLHKSFSK